MTEPSTQPISDLLDSTPSVTDGMSAAFAKLYGEPLFKLPTDLYIPPDALEVFLEAFEGPLDLLLYLIRKQNFNVLDIPMAQVTQQYLSYIDQIRHHNLELAAEYLLMAAMLIEIKSRMLLPMKKADSEEEVEDPRAELVRRLLEYERMKLAAQELDQLPQQGRDFQIAHGFVDTVKTHRFAAKTISVYFIGGQYLLIFCNFIINPIRHFVLPRVYSHTFHLFLCRLFFQGYIVKM